MTGYYLRRELSDKANPQTWAKGVTALPCSRHEREALTCRRGSVGGRNLFFGTNPELGKVA